MVINLEHDSTSVVYILDSFMFMRLNVKLQVQKWSAVRIQNPSESKYYRTSIDGRGIMYICVLEVFKRICIRTDRSCRSGPHLKVEESVVYFLLFFARSCDFSRV